MNATSRWVGPALVCLLGAGFLASCGSETRTVGASSSTVPLTSADVQQPGPLAVGVTTVTFVDASRPTMPNGTYAGAPTRTLVTEIWYPTDTAPAPGDDETRDAPLRHGATLPLIVYSHGFISSRTGGAYLARHLASLGYIVAAPDFPLTKMGAPGGANLLDVAQQPGDVRFVIDQLLAGAEFGGAIDRQRIGLTGLSLGGMTTFLATFHPTLRDPRVKASAPMAGVACLFDHAFYDDRHIPLLIVHGDIDAIVPYPENSVVAYQDANAPKYLLTLIGGSHTGFGDGLEFFDTLDNVDDIGCNALRSSRVGDEGLGSLFDTLGGSAAGIVTGQCPAICTGPRPHAMRPSRQHDLTILSVTPFFEATLRGDARAQRFLDTTLAAENPDLQLQRQP